MDTATPGDEIQSNRELLNTTVSKWQSGIKVSKRDNGHSFSSLAESAQTDIPSNRFDDSVATSKSTESTMSLGAEARNPEEPKEAGNPDPLEIESKVYVLPPPPTKNLSIATDDAKRMVSAMIADDEETIRELLQTYDVECKDDNGFTPLILAARYKNENIVKLLLEKGANPGVKDFELRTTLHWLPSPLPEAGEVPISETLIDLLLKNRPPLDVSDIDGVTPLMEACRAGEKLLATKLINHGANVREVSFQKFTPLHYAAFWGRAQMIPLLIASGAMLEAKASTLAYTPLHQAAMGHSDSSDTVEQLLLAGAYKEARTRDSFRTPLLIAITSHSKACVASLLKSGADIEASDYGELRPLHVAAQQGQLEIVKALLDHGANPTIRTRGSLLVMGDKPSGMKTSDDVSRGMRSAIRSLLKDAEKTWKQSGKK